MKNQIQYSHMKGVMITMKESILLFNLQDKNARLKLEKALFPLKIRIRSIPKEQYNQPLGVLAGIKEIPEAEGTFVGEELPDTMFVFAFLTDSRLNQVLAAIRKSGVGPFPYKAILTPTNQFWTAHECFHEIAEEHEMMRKQSN